MQLVRFAPVRLGYQDGFLGSGRQAEEDAEVDVLFTPVFLVGSSLAGLFLIHFHLSGRELPWSGLGCVCGMMPASVCIMINWFLDDGV